MWNLLTVFRFLFYLFSDNKNIININYWQIVINSFNVFVFFFFWENFPYRLLRIWINLYSWMKKKWKMPPFIKESINDIIDDDIPDLEPVIDPTLDKQLQPSKEKYSIKIVWRNVILMSALHIAAIYGAYLCFVSAKWQTNLAGKLLNVNVIEINYNNIYFVITAFVLYQMGGLGITAGCHRLWAHKAYKARLPLRILLAMFQTIAFQVFLLFVLLWIIFLKLCFIIYQHSEPYLWMVSWSSCSSQIFGNGCRSTQFSTWLLLCSRWLVVGTKASRRYS